MQGKYENVEGRFLGSKGNVVMAQWCGGGRAKGHKSGTVPRLNSNHSPRGSSSCPMWNMRMAKETGCRRSPNCETLGRVGKSVVPPSRRRDRFQKVPFCSAPVSPARHGGDHGPYIPKIRSLVSLPVPPSLFPSPLHRLLRYR